VEKEMRVRLIYKIFLAFLSTSLIVIVLMTGIMGYFVKHNFEDFLNKVEMERLDGLVSTLAATYREHHGWEFIKENPMTFQKMILADFQAHGPGRPEGLPDKPPENAPRDGFHPERDDFPRPPEPRIERRFSLLDEHMHLVAGIDASRVDAILKEIKVNGKIVGWVALRKRISMTNPLELHFIYQQLNAFLTIGLAALALAALVSYVLSRHLLRPVEQLAKGSHALMHRRFDTRITVESKDELGQLADDFNAMAQTLERYENMRRQWISDISHELRTPLAILRGEIEAIQDGVRQAGRETFDSLHTEIMHMNSMVDDLHELSLADTGNLTVKNEPVMVFDVLNEVIKVFEPRYSQAGITIEFDRGLDTDAIIMADRERMFQVYSNILENTLRYTEPPGRLRIWQSRTDAQVRINFEDTKPGVPAESLDRIFDRLYRVDQSRSRRGGGTGLGLAICRSFVEMFKGDIKAFPSSLGGVRIEITLPLKME
jgi:two-component system, OmpR family, sensor histidine kinase BaeS